MIMADGFGGGIFGLAVAFGVVVYRLRLPMYAGVRRRLLLMLGAKLAADLTVGVSIAISGGLRCEFARG